VVHEAPALLVVGALNLDVDAALDAVGEPDAQARTAALIGALTSGMAGSLPLGRKLIKLTVDAPPDGSGPRRGYRRIRWIEQALGPVRSQLGPYRFERLVSALAVLIGWEAYIVLLDVRDVPADQACGILTDAAVALIDAALAVKDKADEGTAAEG
jgi:hypothetical protein